MLERLSPAKRNLALAAVGAVCLWFFWNVRAVLNPLLLGYLLAFILHPLVERLEGHGISRRKAVNLIFALGFLLLLVGAGAMVLQAQRLVVEFLGDEGVVNDLEQRLSEARGSIVGLVGERWVPESFDVRSVYELLAQLYREHTATAQAAGKAGLEAAGGVVGYVLRTAGSLVEMVSLVLLLPIYTYYLLFELERIHGFVRRYLPVRERTRMVRIGRQVGEIIASFFRGRVLVCILKGAFLSAGLWLADVDFALLFGMGSGFLSLVPFVGPLVGFVFAALVGLLEHGVWSSLVRCTVVFGAAELIEGYLLIPKVLGDSLGLHPVVVLVAILAGGAALGLFGVLAALPLTATLVILFRELVLPALAQFADERSQKSPAGPG